MKIGQTPEPQVGSIPAAAAKRPGQDDAATVAKTAAVTPNAGASVSVSKLSRTLEASSRGESSDIDFSKVETIRAQIDDGTYKVDAEAIADKMLSNAQEMLSPKRN